VVHARVFISRPTPHFSSLIDYSDDVGVRHCVSVDFSESLVISITIFIMIWTAFVLLFILFVWIEIIIYIFIGVCGIIVVIKF